MLTTERVPLCMSDLAPARGGEMAIAYFMGMTSYSALVARRLR
jgi:hypothetical protein